MTLPETDLTRIKRYCESRVPAEYQDQVKVTMKRRGKSVTILECRPPWSEMVGPEWSERPLAQMRYDERTAAWTLYYADRNGRWHVYDLIEPHQSAPRLLDEIEKDPTCIFWG